MTERSIEDCLGEILRIHRHNLIRPLWNEAPEETERTWRDAALMFLQAIDRRGLKVVVRKETKAIASASQRRQFAVEIDNDSTPSQVGPSADECLDDECRDIAALIAAPGETAHHLRGMAFGVDWNKGTPPKLHRNHVLKSLPELLETLSFSEASLPPLDGVLLPQTGEAVEEQCTETEKLLGLLWHVWSEMNAIRTESGAPRGHNRHPKAINEDYWSSLVDAMQVTFGNDAKPWPPGAAKQAFSFSLGAGGELP